MFTYKRTLKKKTSIAPIINSPYRRAGEEVIREVHDASEKFPKFNSCHEGYAIILEELDELKSEVFRKNQDRALMRKEAMQVAAMAIRFMAEMCPTKSDEEEKIKII